MAPYTVAFLPDFRLPPWATVIFSRLVRLPSMLAHALSQVRPPCKTTWNSRHKIPSGLAVCTPATPAASWNETPHLHQATCQRSVLWFYCYYLCQTMEKNLNRSTGFSVPWPWSACMPEKLREQLICLMPSVTFGETTELVKQPG